MFKNIFGQKRKAPASIAAYERRDWYFARTRSWGWLNEHEIFIVDSSRMITCDAWSQEIFLDANGQITVAELFEIVKQQYVASHMDIPTELEQHLIEVLESLVYELKVVAFSATRKPLLPQFDAPIAGE